ncbi:hypothetical protein E2986_04491 [Frieseomelitta varia]|uniref:Odorant receptor n=1 Tax=Frieseomelitta varia TaxID=561572 RepID=A0A833S566_9HYME|nr:hypothetical protein E2986_04491 [Frieseomelitta varia]
MNPSYFTGENISQNYTYETFRNCVMMHNEAIRFCNILNECSQGSYLIQVGLNMLGISATAVQTVVNLDRPEEAMRSALFCGANQFHLFLLSLPSQVLLDHCSDLANNIRYSSTWYRTPVQIQKLLYVMQIRCKKLCSLTAGGLYEMNVENFGITVARYMQILGQDPHHKTSTRNIIVIIMVASVASIFFPTTIEIYASLRNKDIDGVLECLPQIIATSITCVKILNMHFNRQNVSDIFNKLYQMVAKQWVQLKLNGELHVLEEIVMQGNKIAQFYQREHQVQKATTNLNYFTDERVLENNMYENFRNCIRIHKEAIRFFNILNESSQRSYMFQIGLSMLSISTTAVKTALNFNKPEEAMRSAVFCGANQFHLFLLSLPGQVLLDNCFNLTDDIYASAWYNTPVKIQKLLYVMQIRCKKVCSLSAGGLYEMNIENFGIETKTLEIFHVPYYKMIAKYMQILGQDPHHKTSTRNIIVIIVVTSIASIFFPATIEIYVSLCNKDIDGVFECLPHSIATAITIVKILNINFNRRNKFTAVQT